MIKQFKRYKYFIILLLINLLLLLFSFDTGKKVTQISLNNLKEMLSVLPPIFILLGLLDIWIPKEFIMKHMGKDAGVKGGILAFLFGSFSAGPLYAAFPVAAVFIQKGVSITNIFIFICSWSTTKIPMMLFEISQLGSKFALLRFTFNIFGIIIISAILNKTTNEKEKQKIYDLTKQM